MLSCFTYTAVVDIGLQLLGRSVADGHMHMFYLPVDTVRSPTTHKPSEHEVTNPLKDSIWEMKSVSKFTSKETLCGDMWLQ